MTTPTESKQEISQTAQKPEEKETKQPEKKKSHKLAWSLGIIVFVVIILPVLALGYTGLYHIPVVTSLFGTDKPIDLGVHPTEADLASAERDNPMTVNFDPGTFFMTDDNEYLGSVPIDDEHSSEELTAFIEKYHGEGRHVHDIQVKVREGGLEISAFVVPYINAPAYIDVDVARTSDKTVSLNLRKAKVGRLNVPEKYYAEASQKAEEIVNRLISEIPGFTIEQLEYHENTAYLKGTLPETVNPTGVQKPLETFLD